jgi:hypothetical protein
MARDAQDKWLASFWQVWKCGDEFIQCLPLQEYCNPQVGIFNLATKLPPCVIKPDLGPKTYISYGIYI